MHCAAVWGFVMSLQCLDDATLASRATPEDISFCGLGDLLPGLVRFWQISRGLGDLSSAFHVLTYLEST